jgi:hypothetical protein
MLKCLCFTMTFLHIAQTQKHSAPSNSLRNFEKNEYKLHIIPLRNLLACITVQSPSLDTLRMKFETNTLYSAIDVPSPRSMHPLNRARALTSIYNLKQEINIYCWSFITKSAFGAMIRTLACMGGGCGFNPTYLSPFIALLTIVTIYFGI